eukprot:2730376-Pyramimonas_sp.AAC.1
MATPEANRPRNSASHQIPDDICSASTFSEVLQAQDREPEPGEPREPCRTDRFRFSASTGWGTSVGENRESA